MNCNQVQPELLEYSRRALNSPEVAEIRAHLEICEGCRRLLQEERALDARLNRLAAAEPVNDVWALIRARTRPRQSRVGSWIGGINVWYRRAVATALAAGAVAAGIALYNQPQQKPGTMVWTDPTPAPVYQAQWSDDPLNHHEDMMMTYLVDL